MDIINIKNLEVFANHGVLKEENVLGQKFLISASLYVYSRQAGLNDDIDRSVNYADVCSLIKCFVEKNTFKLIETVAERLARDLLLSFDKIKKISLEVKKPWAPIMQSVEYISIKIERSRNKAYLSLGSNIGDKKRYLENAINAINGSEDCRVSKISPFYITKPVGGVKQDDFLNCCIEIETLLTPHELLYFINKIENDNGRERLVHWGPRTLDIDIVLYEDRIIYDDELIIPHKEMSNRRFVLEPLNDIAPYKIHPVLNRSVSELFKSIEDEV